MYDVSDHGYAKFVKRCNHLRDQNKINFQKYHKMRIIALRIRVQQRAREKSMFWMHLIRIGEN